MYHYLKHILLRQLSRRLVLDLRVEDIVSVIIVVANTLLLIEASSILTIRHNNIVGKDVLLAYTSLTSSTIVLSYHSIHQDYLSLV